MLIRVFVTSRENSSWSATLCLYHACNLNPNAEWTPETYILCQVEEEVRST